MELKNKFHPRSMRTHISSGINQITLAMKLSTLNIRPHILEICWHEYALVQTNLASKITMHKKYKTC